MYNESNGPDTVKPNSPVQSELSKLHETIREVTMKVDTLIAGLEQVLREERTQVATNDKGQSLKPPEAPCAISKTIRNYTSMLESLGIKVDTITGRLTV